MEDSKTNQHRKQWREETLSKVDQATLRRGFFGVAVIEYEVVDGVIADNIKTTLRETRSILRRHE